jgi:hypothetical protein
MSWAGHVSLIRGMRNAYKRLVVDLGLDIRIILKCIVEQIEELQVVNLIP